ncbi:MAG TPA: nucleotidyltransferase family protein [Ferrovibrio sp.]|uniref:nucleotidyltransferase domain-containing protein n=1 Tax=Ferrovibrio sp. TaxID=1917215 RepID=UPI002ED1CCFC
MRRVHSAQALRILCEALSPDAGGAAAIAHRREVRDWPAVLALANTHYLGPAMYAALSQAEDWPMLPAELRDYLALLHRQNNSRNRRLRQQAEELFAACNAAGVRAMLLKGGLALFLDHYPDPAARMIRDLDLLVPAVQAEAALAVLRRLGYAAMALYPAGHNAYGDFARAGDAGAVDLHFELIDAPYLLPAADVWQRADRLELAAGRCFIPSLADRLLHNLLHAQIHHIGAFYRGSIELRQLHDFTMLARRHRDGIDWPALAAHCARHRLTLTLQSYLLAAGLFGLDWPLDEAPSAAARRQLRRCLMQIRAPFLERLGLPLANLCAAFAPHRMDGLYGQRQSLLRRRLRHAAQFLKKSNRNGVVARLFKAY